MKLFDCLDALKEPNNWIPNEFPKSWIGLINQMNNSLNSFLVLSLQTTTKPYSKRGPLKLKII
jgi:hypothetical protein